MCDFCLLVLPDLGNLDAAETEDTSATGAILALVGRETASSNPGVRPGLIAAPHTAPPPELSLQISSAASANLTSLLVTPGRIFSLDPACPMLAGGAGRGVCV